MTDPIELAKARVMTQAAQPLSDEPTLEQMMDIHGESLIMGLLLAM